MKISLVCTLSMLVAFALCMNACNKGNNVKNISAYNKTESHNMGRNCMDCHKSGGEGEGWFQVAGTVYTSSFSTTYPNSTVYLYTGPNGTGTLKYTVQVDGKGNFYTTESIDFGSGLYPAIKGNTTTHYMSTVTSTGQCNSCHGVSNDKMFAQ
ncbi:MAG TPA: hypothetical protein PLP34_06265 [Chitinophagaceae bacterium]|nr:hypothetical protein [Chitinophagaceae bacterium]HNF71995.1 hypothetical protein [Chitinophagaceae bacterium]